MYLHYSTDKAGVARVRTYAAQQGWRRNHYSKPAAEARASLQLFARTVLAKCRR